MVGKRPGSAAIWGTMPRPIGLTLSTEAQLDDEYRLRRQRRDWLVGQYGYDEGSAIAYEEDADFIVDRLNAYERYAEQVERWIHAIRRRYLLIEKG